jgi:hypothetical protein
MAIKTVLLITSGLLLLGIFSLPLGYYTFLRIAVTLTAIIVIVNEYKGNIDFWTITLGIIAVLFNPIIPVYFNSKTGWSIIDLIVATVFLIKSLRFKKAK